uniref:Uncharacterized protein LOC100373807 n=1 Tax=Saccoglossus kowalevskii TaxID=10224 RepID=A0ABM0GNN7_SACKO|nr:PREDICTED: uncharacterized protein LOC100373807 [Saccoglossus kowalevskii]
MRVPHSVALLSMVYLYQYCGASTELEGHSCNEDPQVKYSSDTNTRKSGDGTQHDTLFDNIGAVETLQYMISPEDFFSRYVIKRKPVAIRDVVRYWPAFSDWTDKYLSHAYHGVDVFVKRPHDKDEEGITMTIENFMESYEKHHLEFSHEIVSKLHDSVILPTCLRCDNMYVQKMGSFLKIGSGGTSTSVHIEDDDVFLCAVKGNQTVTLVSPLYSKDVYGDDGDQLGVSPISFTNMDLEKFPRVRHAHRLSIELNEGDTLFIPHLWWRHYLLHEGHHKMVSFKWKLNRNVIAGVANYQDQAHADDLSRKLSFSDALIRYEEFFHKIVDMTERPQCTGMEQRMSEYEFESASDETHNDLDMKEEERCYFDVKNFRSPCYLTKCMEENDNELACLKEILIYCYEWEDRGCLYTKLLVNKLGTKITFDTCSFRCGSVQFSLVVIGYKLRLRLLDSITSRSYCTKEPANDSINSSMCSYK